MSAIAGSVVTMLVGMAAIIAVWSGAYANYVKTGLRWPLVVSGLVLIAVGSISLLLSGRRRADHRHAVEGMGALLLVFVVALVLAPPPLGADAASGRTPNRVSFTEAPEPFRPTAPVVAAEAPGEPASSTTTSSTTTLVTPDAGPPEPMDVPQDTYEPSIEDIGVDPLPSSLGPDSTVYAISLYDLIGYALFAPDEILGIPLEIVGFAAPEPDIEGAFRLTRYSISCCAADAFPLQVTIADPPFLPDQDTWVRAEVIWHGEVTDLDEWGDGVPVVEVLDLTPIDPPPDPYES